ncbi:MAG: ATP-binding cassette domain-containing protein [Chloracidobacterium sp.]|uniref:ATP-binding cassette domain-containing protein n=1 Tax=Chloracidobacterium validum TaxID=2821543 RepID=A0ABX8BAP8_9BACT|nr:ATP-binding cassette domain-containing protein [Chloracidobacterium validum]QUW04013.1 ATP-binding cassette domain-containing protein [Chloracidobacterium validum]
MSRFQLELREVCLAYDRAIVLDGISLRVGAGELVMLLGASGSGKTSLLKLMNRLLEPTAGEVWVEGRPAVDWNPVHLRRRMGYVMQDAGLFPHMTVARNVGLLLELERWPAAQRRARVETLLERVGLPASQYADRFPAELSGGERQRVGIARALALDPPLLLLDEPFGALDPVARARLQQAFATLVADLGKTALFVTHDLQEALRIGTRICLLSHGRLVADAPPAKFLELDVPAAREYVQAAGL